MAARRYILSGRVQGVGFRYFVYRVARDLGIKGWVRNRNDGSVEIHAEGAEEALTRFLKKVKSGPSLAWVEHIDVSDAGPRDPAEFTIEG